MKENEVVEVAENAVVVSDGGMLPAQVMPTSGAEYTDIVLMSERADKLVEALNKIMMAAIKITTYLDWVLIGGVPYLQESGAAKVARLFGIGWRILAVEREIDEGYPAFTYRMRFSMGANTIECEGSRSGKDEFFCGRGRSKGPDAIDTLDVKKSAFTNCINNGIKRILPGLRNLDVAALEQGGIDVSKIKGYTFKDGSKGGKGKSSDGIVCEGCGAEISQKVASFSQGKFGKVLCMNCQKKAGTAEKKRVQEPDDEYPPYPGEPPAGR